MSTTPEIIKLLKNVRLSGVLESLEQRNQEAIENKLSYLEFLETVLQDELLRRAQNRFTLRLKQSKMNSNKTLEQFDFSFNPKINQQKIKDIARCQFIHEKVCVLLVGPCGTGKSHLAQALGHCALRHGIETIFFTQTQLFHYLQSAKATGVYQKKLEALIKVPLLIIDDFGLKPLQVSQDEEFHDVISERYEKTSTIVTSNLGFSEWGDAFPNKLLGVATLDRLGHGAYKIVLEGKQL